ncbi:DUF3667 domain-containing protein [Luteimonas marina]|uniref:DUF3667 domain-containing protein n=1 Tax=Luteimonas marina TaxID=488485 RepID=A0A5C5UB42_9GAMM|nr:DUF3667 domain-containing protein [Luteimonas marina]TWT22670.1 DUF3667 domain-containing protein [Luteimonas marina]
MTTPSDPQAASPALPAAPEARGDCANCGTPLLGEHCYACGQPVKGLVRHFSSLVGDVLDSVFEWDSRTPRTLWPLLARPGYLALEYFAGRRIRYVSPFRLFFFLAILTFFVGRLVISFGSENPVRLGGDSGIETARNIAEVEQARDEALAGLAAERAELAPKIEAAEGHAAPANVGTITGLRTADAALQAAETAIRAQADERIAAFRRSEETGGPPPVPRPHRLNFGGDTPWDPEKNPIRIGWLPQFANDWLNRQVARTEKNVQRLQEDPDLFKDSLLGAVPSTLFVLLPLFALMLKVAYLFKRRLYMEHLIVALHSHAFLCLSLLLVFLTMALERWLAPQGGALKIVFDLVEAALWCWMPLYLLLMQKRVYGQGWTMTLIKYAVIGFCYSMLLSFGAAFTTIASLVWM